MAHGFLQSFDKNLTVCSAGTLPAERVNPLAINVMLEAGIDISRHIPNPVEKFLDEEWNFVITVCDHAKETCPVFTGQVKKRLHIGFEDPSESVGSEEYILSRFRKVRDEIRIAFWQFYNENIGQHD